VLLTTIIVAAASAILAFAIAYPLAFVVSTRLTHHKMLAVVLMMIPLWISLLLRIFAWKIILGDRGVLNSFLVTWDILDQPSSLFLYTRFAVFLTLAYVSIPFIFLTSFTAFEKLPQSLIEASRDLGATSAQTFARIVWPLTRPAAGIGFALAFLICVGDYVTPSMVGGLNGTMIGTIIASQFGLAGNWPFGAALSVILLFAVSLALILIFYVSRTNAVIEADSTVTTKQVNWRNASVRERITRMAGWSLLGLAYAILYGPLIIIGIFSLSESQLQTLPLGEWSMRWYTDLLVDRNLLASLQRSLSVGICVALASMFVGTAFAIALARTASPFVRFLQGSLLAPAVLPGIVLGIALTLAFRIVGLEPGFPSIVIGQMTFTVPIVMMIVASRLQSLDPSIPEASADLGATTWQTLLRIKLPLLQGAIIGSGLLAFTMSFDEVIVTIFLTGPEPTLPVYIWNQLRFGFTPVINAAFTLIGVASLILIVLATRVLQLQPMRSP